MDFGNSFYGFCNVAFGQAGNVTGVHDVGLEVWNNFVSYRCSVANALADDTMRHYAFTVSPNGGTARIYIVGCVIPSGRSFELLPLS